MKLAGGVDEMTTFITQGRFTNDGLNGMLAAPEDRAETVERLIAQVGGKPIAHYLTSGEYDVLLVFEAPSYEETVPALLVAAAGSGITDLKTVTALTSSEMKRALVKAGSVAASAGAPTAVPSTRPQTGSTNPDAQCAAEAAQEDQEAAKSAAAILAAEEQAVDDTRAGRPAPYYFAPTESAATRQPAASPRSTKKKGTAGR
jgi:uncharacterized protein with GYD domain